MKNIYKLFIALVLLSAYNCSDNNRLPADNSDSGWLEFKTPSSSGNQSQTMISIPFSAAIGTNATGQEVTYSVSLVSGDVPGSALGTFTTSLPAGDTSGNIAFSVPQTGSAYTVLFTLLNTTNTDYQIGLSDGTKQITHSLFVNCPINIGTTYNGSVTIPDLGLTSANNVAFNFTATITQIDADNYSVDSAWGPDFVATLANDPTAAGLYLYAASLSLKADGSLDVVGLTTNAYATGGTGSYEPCEDTFTYTLTQDLFNGEFNVNVVLSPM